MLSTIILLLLFNAYAVTSGFKDAILWSRTGADAFTWNEHVVFNVERIVIIALAIVATTTSPIHAAGATLAFLLMFSFGHNSAYYYGRSLIAKTPFSWTYSSSTSTAKLEFGFKARLTLFLVGAAVAVASATWM